MEKSKPYVILSAATSVDGKIATRAGDSNLSSKQDKVRLHKLRSKVDAILVGKNTVLLDNPLLTVRYARGKNPIRIILDSKGTISKKSKILQTSDKIPTIIAVSKKISKSNFDKLCKFPVEIITAGKNSVDIKLLLKKLSNKKINTILVEGGGTVNWEFIKHNLFDELIITLSPFLIGGNDAISFVQGKGFEKISNSPNLRLKSIKRLKNHVVLYYVKVYVIYLI
jgi:2,5-diamino-6-(ribosylamino)-4(3H)-pyrimidinone 5'-phosphate reductase